ncbi:MAG: MDR family MFS transporter [Pseudonocardiales bacterium]|nr:MDR family MFS transporter [Pseudonocardiales bacterium]
MPGTAEPAPGRDIDAGPDLDAGLDLPRIRVVVGGLVLTVLLASLDQTILSTALPTIVGELGGVALTPWVITSYLLAATVVMPAYGRLGDVVGRKPLFLAAIGIFLLGSVIGGFAGSVEWLIVGRFVQGLGGGGLVVTAQAIVADVVPPRQRARYTGVLGGVFAISSVAGPLLGGWFTDVAGWRWCFWINLPLGAVALVVAAVVLRVPPGTTRRPRLDLAGMVWSSIGVTCLVLLGTWAGTRYAWTSPTIVGLAVATVLAGVLFVRAESRAAEPVIPLSLFRDRTFVLATAAGLVVSVGLFATSGYLPTLLQMTGGHGPTAAGLLMLPMMAGVLVASTLSGLAISATGRYRGHPIAGMALCAVALVLLSTLDATTGTLLTSLYLLLFGTEVGLVLQVLTLVVQNAVDHALVGTATAATGFVREIGATLGTAVVGSLFTARLAEALAARASGVDAAGLTPAVAAALPDGTRAAVADAYAAALGPVLGGLVPLFVVGLVLVVLLPRTPLRTTFAPTTPSTPST